MDKIVFLSNEKQIRHLLKDNKKTDYTVITLKTYLKRKCEEEVSSKIKVFSFDELVSNYKTWEECQREAKDLFDKWNKIKINSKYVFTEFLGYKGYSLLEIDAVRYLSVHSDKIAKLLFKASVIYSIIENLSPTTIVTLHPRGDWERITRMVCCNKSIDLIERRKLLDKLMQPLMSRSLKIDIKLFNRYSVIIPFAVIPFIMKLNNYRHLIFKYTKVEKTQISDKREVLFFVINRKYLDIIIPVVQSIQKDNKFKPLVLIPDSFDACELLKENSIPFEYIGSYLTDKTIKESLKHYSTITKRYKKLKKLREFKNKVYRYQKLNFEDFLSKELEKTFLLSVTSIKYILLIKKIVKLHSAKVMVIPHISENIVKSITVGCREIGIPVINIKRSTAFWHPEMGTFSGDRLLVAGSYAKRAFKELGIEETKIRVTGLPIFDELLKKLQDNRSIKEKTKKDLGVELGSRIIIYLTQSQSGSFGYTEKLNEIKNIFKVVKKLPGVFLIIKVHPTEKDIDVYEMIANELQIKKHSTIKDEIPLDDLLVASEIAITKNSTTGFNALIAECDLIIVGFHDKRFTNNFFVESEIGLTSTTFYELYSNIVKIINEGALVQKSKVREFLKDHFYKLDFKSTKRIKENIYEMVGKNKNQ